MGEPVGYSNQLEVEMQSEMAFSVGDMTCIQRQFLLQGHPVSFTDLAFKCSFSLEIVDSQSLVTVRQLIIFFSVTNVFMCGMTSRIPKTLGPS